jgi:predicted transcriptional regulator
MLWKADEMLELQQQILNATVANRQLAAQLKELQENLLIEAKTTNQLLRRLAGLSTNEMPAVREVAQRERRALPPLPYDP